MKSTFAYDDQFHEINKSNQLQYFLKSTFVQIVNR